MKLEKTLTQQSYFYFIVFFLLVIAAFWMTYITRISEQPNYRMHLHGITLTLWCVMLISQAYLIRSRNNGLHKRIGKISYLLVPLSVEQGPASPYHRLSLRRAGGQRPGRIRDSLWACDILPKEIRASCSLHGEHGVSICNPGYRQNHSHLFSFCRT
jgi:hypothetical protein